MYRVGNRKIQNFALNRGGVYQGGGFGMNLTVIDFYRATIWIKGQWLLVSTLEIIFLVLRQ